MSTDLVTHTFDKDTVIAATRQWLEIAVIGLNLCPFAKSVHVRQQIRFLVSDATTHAQLRDDLTNELHFLSKCDPALIDTTLLILPGMLTDFLDYRDFLHIADRLVRKLKLEGILQIASFHPCYQFAENQADDISNFTNRSPYPMLHVLRESSVERAVAAFPDAGAIVERNLSTMARLGHAGWSALGIPIAPRRD